MTARTVRRRLGRVRSTGDGGVTLVEVLVAMTVMSIFMAMFTTSTVRMFRAANHSEAVSVAQTQLNLAFGRLDREIRYAAAISTQNTSGYGGDFYIEYTTTNAASPICTALRVDRDSRQLQRLTWTQGSSPAGAPWTPLASNITVPAASTPPSTPPFTYLAPDATNKYQRLRIELQATSGDITKRSDIMFTALNSSSLATSGSVCPEGRSVP